MVDRDEEGYLLQIFTKPVEDPPYPFSLKLFNVKEPSHLVKEIFRPYLNL
jgi:hypothetical protein